MIKNTKENITKARRRGYMWWVEDISYVGTDFIATKIELRNWPNDNSFLQYEQKNMFFTHKEALAYAEKCNLRGRALRSIALKSELKAIASYLSK